MHKIMPALKRPYSPRLDGKNMDVEDSELERHDHARIAAGFKLPDTEERAEMIGLCGLGNKSSGVP